MIRKMGALWGVDVPSLDDEEPEAEAEVKEKPQSFRDKVEARKRREQGETSSMPGTGFVQI